MTDPYARTNEGFFDRIMQRIDAVESRLARGGLPKRLMTAGVGTTAERDAFYGVPATTAERVDLANRQVTWYNTDLGWQESYYVPSNSFGLTARGILVHANVPAGWYPTGRGPRAVLYASAPQAFGGSGNFTNWRNFGAATTDPSQDSWKNTPGNLNDGSAIIHRENGNAAIQVFLAGRYRVSHNMHFPNGSGTAVASTRVVPNNGTATERIEQFPVPLLAGFGQIVQSGFDDIVIGRTGYAYFRLDSGTLSVGSANDSWFSVEYLGPPLVTRP